MESHLIRRAARALVLLIALTCHPQHFIYAEERSVLAITEEEFEICASVPRCSALLVSYVERGSLQILLPEENNEPPVAPPEIIPKLDELFDELAKLPRVCFHFRCKCGVTLRKTWNDIIYKWLQKLGVEEPPTALDLLNPNEEQIDEFLKELQKVLKGKTNQKFIELLQKLKQLHPTLSEIIDALIDELMRRGVNAIIGEDLIEQFLKRLRQLILPADTKAVVSAISSDYNYCIASADQFMILR
jgi:hypothetical protein